MKKIFKILFVSLFLIGNIYPQITVVLTIENQNVVGTDFFFDLYLRTNQASDSLFLGNSDYVLTFDVSNFNSPALSLEGDIFGEAYCTFVPRIAAQASGTRTLYTSVIATQILNGNQLVINTNGPTASSQTYFNNRIARIDNIPLTHRLGRFKVSGIINPNGFMNLQWVNESTLVATISPTTLSESQTIVSAINPANAPLPVELTSFTAKAVDNNVELNWETKTEVNNYGFEIERATKKENQENIWVKTGFVEGNGNSNSPKQYSFLDENLSCGDYYYRLKQIDTDGQYEYSSEILVTVDIPRDYVLEQNYPNPFNPTTTIEFSIPEQGEVRLTIFNLLGQEILTLVEEQRQAGNYTEYFDATGLNSGVYFYELRINNFVVTKKMQLVK